ncbi:GGDEF domain-containing protein [Marinomonas mediterranea]|jgi:diguanylate cyclase (GGDEF) domain|uniref:Diguanylate cyclase n=1 Tax=Marinomonas mediterranea (strain ATCC 700492 / JCM 21426 / NBRC 103028 / MMB-1) TaxID=717774 RepID=F2K204_MARM1|nr:sensor domain-containing diguanylate cyclase [Marinomonas mediterranea]ADZ89998.1 diguanylate cyclase [Marinomonas mediterranea MMB-1]WCN08064.1 diguanylate cyclase [Marinomonas mediterranea]WCN12158.1 diguanylate cyclase [Marinomonas mediterranea]WCN16206.1 diguanylate cyclase [Marinomonas mediterranea MMB-1]
MSVPFQTAFELMPTPAFIVRTADGEITAVNHNLQQLYANVDATMPSNWKSCIADPIADDGWNAFVEGVTSNDIERCSVALQMGSNELDVDIQFRVADKNHFVGCVYSPEYKDLRATENTLLKFTLSESSAGLWVWETASDSVYCSASLATLLHCSDLKTPKTTPEWHQLVHADDVERLSNIVNSFVKNRLVGYEAEYRILSDQNNYLWVKERGRAYSHTADGDISRVVGFVEDISSQKTLEEHLRAQATFDELTGLLTRGAALTHFKKQLELARRQYTPLTMAKIDLDANDTLKYISQDKRNMAIHTSAHYFYKKMRDADILARVAEEKLLLLLPNTSVKDATRLLNAMLEPDEREEKALAYSDTSHTNFCIGIATFPEDGETIEELAESANNAVEEGRRIRQSVVVN